jgi:hypothetical protein
MAEWTNFVQVTLNQAAAFGDTTLIVNKASGGWKDPPNPNGSTAYLTLTDSIDTPTKFEIVSYTGRLGFGPYSLTGVTRALEGTVALNWSSGAYVIQFMTSGNVFDKESILDGGVF